MASARAESQLNLPHRCTSGGPKKPGDENIPSRGRTGGGARTAHSEAITHFSAALGLLRLCPQAGGQGTRSAAASCYHWLKTVVRAGDPLKSRGTLLRAAENVQKTQLNRDPRCDAALQLTKLTFTVGLPARPKRRAYSTKRFRDSAPGDSRSRRKPSR